MQSIFFLFFLVHSQKRSISLNRRQVSIFLEICLLETKARKVDWGDVDVIINDFEEHEHDKLPLAKAKLEG